MAYTVPVPQVPQSTYTFLHPGKSGGGFLRSFTDIRQCHPKPCMCDDAIITIRDPVERFHSAYYYAYTNACKDNDTRTPWNHKDAWDINEYCNPHRRELFHTYGSNISAYILNSEYIHRPLPHMSPLVNWVKKVRGHLAVIPMVPPHFTKHFVCDMLNRVGVSCGSTKHANRHESNKEKYPDMIRAAREKIRAHYARDYALIRSLTTRKHCMHSEECLRLMSSISPPISTTISGVRVRYSGIMPPGDIIYGVLSAVKNIERRTFIRNTWGHDVSVVFIIASTTPLEEEVEYGDIIRVHRYENFHNITFQTQAFIHAAAATSCSYAVKTDDDSVIHVHDIHPTGDYWGYLIKHVKASRKKDWKYYVSYEDWPNSTYPPFLAGQGYAMSLRFLKCASDLLPNVKFMPMEDIATALLARTCGAQAVQSPRGVIQHKTVFDRRSKMFRRHRLHRLHRLHRGRSFRQAQKRRPGNLVFVHIPKNAGTTIRKSLFKNISVCGHGGAAKCVGQGRAIVVLRNPYERFASAMHYFVNFWTPRYGRNITNVNDWIDVADDEMRNYEGQRIDDVLLDRAWIWTQQSEWVRDLVDPIILRFEHLREDFEAAHIGHLIDAHLTYGPRGAVKNIPRTHECFLERTCKYVEQKYAEDLQRIPSKCPRC